MNLSDLKINESGIITKVGGEGALRLRLLDMGIIPKTKVKIQKTAPLGDPIQILIRGYELTLRKDDASVIEIAKEEEASA
jgi:ferrous iron transport protein A